MGLNSAILIGRLTREPELRYIPVSGRAVCNFTLAVDKGMNRETREEMKAKNEPTADFIRITVWGNMAENCANYLDKGRLVAVQGRIQTGSYDDQQGNKRYTFEVVANSTEFLEWGDKKDNQGQGNRDNGFGGIDGFHPTDNSDIPF